MRKIFTGLILFGLVHFVYGQERQTYEKTAFLEGDFSFFTIDDLNQIYTLDVSNQLTKFNIDGESLFKYSNNEMGTPTIIDVANPLNILMFYPDYQIALTLTRTLSESAEYDLFGPETLEVTAACLSIENRLWVFDASNYRLKLIDVRGNSIEESDDLSLYFDAPPVITQMEAHQGYIYANVPDSGIVLFDNYGQFDKEIPISEIDHFQFFKTRLIYQKENELKELDLYTLKERTLNLPFKIEDGQYVKLKNNYIFRLKINEGIEVWKAIKK